MAARRLPNFRYHPDPITNRVIVQRQTACPVCDEVTGYAYDGPYFTQADVQNICPWCIDSGLAARTYEMEFVYACDLEPVSDTAKLEELQWRTPGYFFGSQYEWPVHCNDFCALLHEVQWSGIVHLEAELETDLNRLEVEDGDDRQAKRDALSGDALWSYIFKCLHCGQHRLASSYE